MDQEKQFLKIGDLAKMAGVTVRTVRYYEELGLLEPAETTPGGFRLYTKEDLRKLFYIKRFKELEFSLEVIKALFESNSKADGKSERISASLKLLQEQKLQVEEKINKLEELKVEIEKAIVSVNNCRKCSKQYCPSDCPNQEAML